MTGGTSVLICGDVRSSWCCCAFWKARSESSALLPTGEVLMIPPADRHGDDSRDKKRGEVLGLVPAGCDEPPLIRREKPEQERLDDAFLGDKLPEGKGADQVHDEAHDAEEASDGKAEAREAPGQEREHDHERANPSDQLESLFQVKVSSVLLLLFLLSLLLGLGGLWFRIGRPSARFAGGLARSSPTEVTAPTRGAWDDLEPSIDASSSSRNEEPADSGPERECDAPLAAPTAAGIRSRACGSRLESVALRFETAPPVRVCRRTGHSHAGAAAVAADLLPGQIRALVAELSSACRAGEPECRRRRTLLVDRFLRRRNR